MKEINVEKITVEINENDMELSQAISQTQKIAEEHN